MRRLALLLLLAAAAAAQQPPKVQENITVERIIVDARVTDAIGDPILGLTPADFRVKVDGRNAVIESVEWVPDTAAAREIAEVSQPPDAPTKSLDTPPPAGRLFVFLFQRDPAQNNLRITGQMKIVRYAQDFVESLDPEDRVAVFSFDSHLKFRLDFSNDHEKILEAMREALLANEPPPPALAHAPALGSRLDREQMKKAATSEVALLIIGNALRPIPGPKSLILFGWGLGRLTSSGVVMDRRYRGAQYALESSRTAVYSLDITQADYHSLGVGLQRAAEDTGGFYASTYLFPRFGLDKLTRTLAGHYELEVRKPAGLKMGVHTIDVTVVGRRGAEVFTRKTYVDRGE